MIRTLRLWTPSRSGVTLPDMWKSILAAAILAGAASATVGYQLGHDSGQPEWLTGTAHVSSLAHKATFKVDGRYYGVHDSVAWFDQAGSFHEDGWPACLTDATSTARFQALSQSVETVGWPVIAVDCR